MQRFTGIVVSLAAAAVAFDSFLVVGSARAEDAPGGAGGPQAQKKIEHPMVKAWVGDWDVAVTMGGKESHAKSKISMGVAGTAVLEDYSGEMMGSPFAGHGILKLGDDGKTVSMWWFDNMMPDPVKFTGTMGEKSLEVSGTLQMGTMKITLKQVDGGFDWEGTMGDQPWLTQKYRKAK